MNGELVIFAIPNGLTLAAKICEFLQGKRPTKVLPGPLKFEPFSDGEVYCEYGESIRGMDVFILGSTNPPAENMLQLQMAIDAARRAHANRIVVVVPYFGYARQERRKGKRPNNDRVAVSAKLFARCLEQAGANYVMVVDPHFKNMDAFFDIEFETVFGTPTLVKAAQNQISGKIVAVSPDAGGIDRARANAKAYDWSLAFLDKRRGQANQSEVLHVVGDVAGANCLIVDDICDTAGTIAKGAAALKAAGASSVYVAVTHPVLSGKAIENLAAAPIEKIWMSDTIALPPEKRLPNMEIVSIAEILADTIWAVHSDASVSEIFKV